MRLLIRALLPALAFAAVAAAAPAPASAGASTGSWRECRPYCGPGYYRHRVYPNRYHHRRDSWRWRHAHRQHWRGHHRNYRYGR